MAGPSLDRDRARSVVRIRVRFGETDLMGIVHHASYVLYMEVARIEWLRRRGVTYASWAERGNHLPVVDMSIRYRAPVRFDDEIEVVTELVEIRAASLKFDYRISKAGNPAICAEGSTLLACVDDSHALRRFTPEMVAALSVEEGSGINGGPPRE
jgi:acyl-CoA thioester hydrolase